MNVAGLWSRWSERVSLTASGAATRVDDGRSTGIAIGSASYLVPLNQFRFEAGGTATILGTSGLGPTSSFLGFARAHALGHQRGAWVGAGGGSSHLDGVSFGAETGELGLWARRGEQRVTLAATATRTSLVETVRFSDQTFLRRREPVGYSDVSLIGHGVWRQLEIDGIATSRHTWRGSLASSPTATIAAAWWLTPYVAVAGAVGQQLSDPMRGTVRARYGTVALRFSAERHGALRAPTRPPPVAVGEASIVAVAADGGAAVVRVSAGGARTVELMGDITGWAPVSLERRGDGWERRLTSASGAHHVLVRIDGGAWVPPSNLPHIDDELGGKVGLLIIP